MEPFEGADGRAEQVAERARQGAGVTGGARATTWGPGQVERGDGDRATWVTRRGRGRARRAARAWQSDSGADDGTGALWRGQVRAGERRQVR